MSHLRDTVAVVTGASSGVGRATARELARRGAAVGLVARGREGLEAARREIEHSGGRAVALPLDVADAAAVERAADDVERELGPIGAWVNSAMVSVFSPVHELQAEEARRVIEVTYLGSVHGTLAALRRMRPRDRGVIVQVGSALAHRAIPLQAAYCAAKHAVEGFSESLRCELLHESSGVQVTQVHLPALDTPHFGVVRTRLPGRPQPVPPIYEPDVAAEAIAWAIEHPRREVWVGHSTALAVLGNRVAPGLLDRYLARTGFDAQQTDDPVDSARPDNLFAPLPGDRGARGAFADRARPRSLQLWAARHRTALAGAALAATVLAESTRRRASRM